MKRTDLHEYQNYCVEFLKTHPEALLILEMGLGKSAVSLTAILDLMFDSFDVGKVLVIAPLRVAKTVWPEERETWKHANFLRMSVMVGSAKQREAALRNPADVYVINRENVKWLVDYLEKEGPTTDPAHGRPHRHSGQQWLDGFVGRDLPDRQGHPAWPVHRQVPGGVFQTSGHEPLHRHRLQLPPASRRGGSDLQQDLRHLRLHESAGLSGYARELSDISVSMKALDYLDMPESVTVNHYVDMEPAERDLYDAMKKELLVEVDGETIDAANAAVLSGKLLQMANGALYNADREMRVIHDRKLEMLGDLIEQANGQNVLVAYWYQHDHERIREYLTELGYKPRDLKSDQDIADWNAGKIQVALISPASAGHGLNIQRGGHILIWFSLVWSLELYQQTNARLWRQGQKEVVTIHHILTRDTVDGDVLDALKHKDTTQQNLIAAVKAHLTI